MRIMKTTGRRGPTDVMWSVNGMVRVATIEQAAELAFDTYAEVVAQAPQHTLWTVYGGAA